MQKISKDSELMKRVREKREELDKANEADSPDNRPVNAANSLEPPPPLGTGSHEGKGQGNVTIGPLDGCGPEELIPEPLTPKGMGLAVAAGFANPDGSPVSDDEGPEVEPDFVPARKRLRGANALHRNQTHPGEAERIAERRERVWELKRKYGYSNRRIARELDVSECTVRNDIRAMLTKLHEDTEHLAAGWREMELQRLDAAMEPLYEAMTAGNVKAAEAWIKLSESRRKLLGLDAVQKVEQETTIRFEETENW